MEPQKYKLVFNGELVEGEQAAKVKENIATLMRTEAASLEKSFNGETLVLKSGLDHDKALKLKEVFKQKGAICQVEPAEMHEVVSVHTPSKKSEQVVDVEVVEPMTAQTIVVAGVAIVVRTVWSLTIGIPFFIAGLIGFLVLDITQPNSDKGYILLTNMYKWGSCHWFKQVKLETQDFEVDVKKRKIQ